MVVTGYADSETGSAEFNQKLSEERANTVANELQNMGVSASKITAKGNGGVADLTPIANNRRAIVQIAK